MNINQVASDVVKGLQSAPLLLGVLVLNIVMVSAATYFLIRFGEANSARIELILKSCLPSPPT
jgi:hypothetical protein